MKRYQAFILFLFLTFSVYLNMPTTVFAKENREPFSENGKQWSFSSNRWEPRYYKHENKSFQLMSSNIGTLSISNDNYKYYDYTNEQLKREFNSYVLDISESDYTKRTRTVYYDGEINIEIISEGNGNNWLGNHYNKSSIIDFAKNSETNTIMIFVDEGYDKSAVFDIEREVYLAVRLEDMISGVTEDTILADFNSVATLQVRDWSSGNTEYGVEMQWENSTDYLYFASAAICGESGIYPTSIVRELDLAVISPILELANHNWELADQKMSEYVMTKKVNPNAYVHVSRMKSQNSF